MVKKIMAFVFSVLMASGANTASVDVNSCTALSKNTDEIEGVLYKDDYVSVDVECSPTSISAAAACKRALENTDDNFDSIMKQIYYRIYRASGNGWMSVTIYSSEIEDRTVFDVDRAVETLIDRGYAVNLSKDSQGWVLEIVWADCYE